MSRAKTVLETVLGFVSSETDVAMSKIMSRCSEADVVDARWICVKLLSRQGFYPSKIAELLGISPRYVQYILTDFDDRAMVNISLKRSYLDCVSKLRR